MVFFQRASQYVLFGCNIQGLTAFYGFGYSNKKTIGTIFPFAESSQSGIPDIPHRGSIVRFCESDTIALEKAYRYAAEYPWCLSFKGL